MLLLVSKKGWDNEDVEVLAAASIDDYYALFKSLSGGNTRVVVRACLRFEELASTNPAYKRIGERASAALARIADESPLNRRRVQSHGGGL